ncbi:MAG: class I SAM-dependent methyltransferase [Acidimicrobiia bacterium]|nr:class I SAM-dependent methyltransferase [Acidimicrobiia bacterium]MDH5616960.1 class I SAM-dependent methyltransferase [Acidimicrobiia bacterium]
MEANDVKDALTAHYDAAASQRDTRGLVDFRDGYRRRFADLLGQERIGELVDLGAGTGHESLWFTQQGLTVSAVDLSPAHVELCRAKGIEAAVGDFYDLPFRSSRFPAGWCMSSLMHVPNADLDLVLREIGRIFEPDAPVALGFWGGRDTEGIWERDSAQPKRFYSLRSEATMRDALGGHFDLVEFETREVEGVSGWPYQFWIVRRPRGLKLGAVGPSGP